MPIWLVPQTSGSFLSLNFWQENKNQGVCIPSSWAASMCYFRTKNTKDMISWLVFRQKLVLYKVKLRCSISIRSSNCDCHDATVVCLWLSTLVTLKLAAPRNISNAWPRRFISDTPFIGAEGNRATCQQLPYRRRKAGENQCWTDPVKPPPFSRIPIQEMQSVRYESRKKKYTWEQNQYNV